LRNPVGKINFGKWLTTKEPEPWPEQKALECSLEEKE